MMKAYFCMFRQVTRMCILLDIILLFGLNILQQNTMKSSRKKLQNLQMWIHLNVLNQTTSTSIHFTFSGFKLDHFHVGLLIRHISSVSSKLSIDNLEFSLLTFNFWSFWALCALGRREVTFARFLYYYRQLLGDNSFFGCVPCPWVGILSNLHT